MADPRLVSYLETHGGEALLSAEPGIVRVLTGHVPDVGSGPSPFALPAMVLAPGSGEAHLICSADEAQAGETVHVYEGFTAGPADPLRGAEEALAAALRAAGAGVVLVDDATVPAGPARALGDGARPAPGLPWLGAVKTPEEIAAVEAALRVCEAGHRAAREATRPGVNELEIWAAVSAAMTRTVGGRLVSIADLVTGPRTADVGGPPVDRPVQEGDLVLCDLVPRVDGIWGDSCATWAAGEPPAWAEQLHETATRALGEGLALLRPGVRAGQVHDRVRAVMNDGGWEYPHHTGHGLGFRWHEQPRIIKGDETVLEEGMVVALEPGGYADGRGLRVEQIAVVSPEGGRVLSRHPLSLERDAG